MFQWSAYLIALGVILTAGTGVWLASLLKRDVSIVDSLWPVMFLLAAVTYDLALVDTGPRAALLLMLVGIWALRLFVYITWRNWGEDEDRRYQAIRANNQPNFELKSLFIVFILQGFIAWIVSLPLMAAIGSDAAPNPVDYLGIGLWAIGMLFEAGGDYQLMRFKSDPANRDKVMDRGLWRYSRHPNYFGNACIWWGFGLIAAAAGAWWALVSPLVMTFLLLRVSGVSLLEQDIGERRPAYAGYIERTSAFFPLPPKKARTDAGQTAGRG
jgi:steroid 5-alpha reductase family enzyme